VLDAIVPAGETANVDVAAYAPVQAAYLAAAWGGWSKPVLHGVKLRRWGVVCPAEKPHSARIYTPQSAYASRRWSEAWLEAEPTAQHLGV